jgi:AmmeMemoRadiSam system protein B
LAKKSPVLLLTQGLPYAPTGAVLAEQLEGWLAAVETSNDSSAPSRALISPYVRPLPQPHPTRAQVPECGVRASRHAGYSYSGPTAAWAYRAIDPSTMYVAPP